MATLPANIEAAVESKIQWLQRRNNPFEAKIAGVLLTLAGGAFTGAGGVSLLRVYEAAEGAFPPQEKAVATTFVVLGLLIVAGAAVFWNKQIPAIEKNFAEDNESAMTLRQNLTALQKQLLPLPDPADLAPKRDVWE